jgi:hypothetical protein
MNKVEIIPIGKTLYHGSKYKLSTGYPTGDKGIWFATNPVQSILHVASRSGSNVPNYMYIYKVKTPLKVIKFDSGKNINNWAVREGFTLPNNTKTFAFSNKDYQLAEYLCKQGVYDGWWFPNDQTQVMLCKPSELLNFVKVMDISFPYGKPQRSITWNRGNNHGRYIVSNNGRKYKYKLTNIKLNNLKNITNVPRNALYGLSSSNGTNIFFDSTGKQIHGITRNKFWSNNGFNVNGKKYYGSGSGGSMNIDHEKKLKELIRAKNNSINIKNRYLQRYGILTENQKLNKNRKEALMKPLLNKYRVNVNKYYNNLHNWETAGGPRPIRPNRPKNINNRPSLQPLPHKTMNNVNINSSNIFKN